jgi:hypothetical protein
MAAEIKTVDDYLAGLSPAERKVLERVRRTIKEAGSGRRGEDLLSDPALPPAR